ncbi:hypothetical protein FOL47_008149 [Perkinsus chesapeaki]|uniref:Uncharacterized protein n=1 Tax=Perkinsus chesapeaki TaxID=330153 RepID=A0A7J6LFT8_PERCH|nr:hypothetical protein FOL47_008149 [Perkinsus chesapeaki]
MVTSRAQQQETSKRFPSDDRILGEIWADAYAAWDFGDYRPGGPVQYIRPLAQDSEKTPLGTLHLPHPVVFEITAFNPAALSKNLPTNKTNFKMLRQLRREVQKLSSPKPAMALHSFGFDSSWREDGLMVAYAAESDRERARADMIRLGKEFGQGAIYEIRRLLEDDPELVATRTTVPCSEEFEETRAVVKITGAYSTLSADQMGEVSDSVPLSPEQAQQTHVHVKYTISRGDDTASLLAEATKLKEWVAGSKPSSNLDKFVSDLVSQLNKTHVQLQHLAIKAAEEARKVPRSFTEGKRKVAEMKKLRSKRCTMKKLTVSQLERAAVAAGDLKMPFIVTNGTGCCMNSDDLRRWTAESMSGKEFQKVMVNFLTPQDKQMAAMGVGVPKKEITFSGYLSKCFFNKLPGSETENCEVELPVKSWLPTDASLDFNTRYDRMGELLLKPNSWARLMSWREHLIEAAWDDITSVIEAASGDDMNKASHSSPILSKLDFSQRDHLFNAFTSSHRKLVVGPSGSGGDLKRTPTGEAMEKFIELREEFGLRNYRECQQNPGDVVFVPKGSWSVALSTTDSISIRESYVNNENAEALAGLIHRRVFDPEANVYSKIFCLDEEEIEVQPNLTPEAKKAFLKSISESSPLLQTLEVFGVLSNCAGVQHAFGGKVQGGLTSSLRQSFEMESDPYPLKVVLEVDMQDLLTCSVMGRNILSNGWGPTVTFLRLCFGFVLQELLLHGRIKVVHHLINFTLAPRNGLNLPVKGLCPLPRRFARCILVRPTTDEFFYAWCTTGRACCGGQERIAHSQAFPTLRSEQAFEFLLRADGTAFTAFITFNGEILRQTKHRGLLAEGTGLDAIVVEMPSIRQQRNMRRDSSDWSPPQFICLSVPSLAPKSLMRLPEPRVGGDPLGALLERMPAGTSTETAAVLIASLIDVPVTLSSTSLVDDEHDDTWLTSDSEGPFKEDLFKSHHQSIPPITNRPCHCLLIYTKDTAIHPKDYFETVLSACGTSAAWELSGSLTATAVADILIRSGACSHGASRPVTLDLDTGSTTRNIVALMHDVMLKQRLLSPNTKSFVPCDCTVWGWISSEAFNKPSPDLQALLSYFDFVLELGRGDVQLREGPSSCSTWRPARPTRCLLASSTAKSLERLGQDLEQSERHHLVAVARAIATVRGCRNEQVYVDDGDILRAQEILSCLGGGRSRRSGRSEDVSQDDS